MAFKVESVMASPTPSPLPNSAQAVAWLASALGLANVRGGTSRVSESTAKRIAACNPSVSDNKISALLEDLVDGLFTPSYLAARGLKGERAAEHRTVLLAGLEGALAVWDRFAALVNRADHGERATIVQFWGATALGEIGIRIAAYVTLYGQVAPAWRRIGTWMRKPGIAEALRKLRESGKTRISDAALRKKSKLQPHTFRDLREGRRLPKEDTLLRLARALSRPHLNEGPAVDEITFELRLACLVARLRDALAAHPDVAKALDLVHKLQLKFYVHDLRRYFSTELASIVAMGSHWPRWSEVHERFKHVLMGNVFHLVAGMNADVVRFEAEYQRLAEQDQSEAFRHAANHCHALAVQARESVSGIPGWERTTGGDTVRLLEDVASMFLAIADDDTPQESRLDREAFRAKCLCDEALAPWNRYTPEQKDALYRRAVEMDPACAYVRGQYGSFLVGDSSRIDEAIQHFRIAVMLDEDYREARLILAGALVDTGRHAEALEHVDVLERHDGLSSRTAFVRGSALLGLGEPSAARALFERVLEVSLHDVLGHAGMSAALEALGDRRGVRRHQRMFDLLSGRRRG